MTTSKSGNCSKSPEMIAIASGCLIGAERALKPPQAWANRFLLDREKRVRDRARFDLAIDSKLSPNVNVVVEVELGDPAWHITVQSKPTEPSIGEVYVHLFAQPPLGLDAEPIPDDEHSDNEIEIDRGTPCFALEWRQLLTQFAEIDGVIDRPHQMLLRDMCLERELVESSLLDSPWSHHRLSLRLLTE